MTNPFYRSPYWKDLRRQALARDRFRCTAKGCGHTVNTSVLYVDHIQTRPNVPYATTLDVLSNLRTLCVHHDAQVKELAGGRRRQNGIMKGCDENGAPLDPNHPWNRKETA